MKEPKDAKDSPHHCYINLPPDLYEQVKHAAKKDYRSVSSWLAQAAREKLLQTTEKT